MEADVVVNFINFFTDIEEEDIAQVLDELHNAGLNPESIEIMICNLLPQPELNKLSDTFNNQPG